MTRSTGFALVLTAVAVGLAASPAVASRLHRAPTSGHSKGHVDTSHTAKHSKHAAPATAPAAAKSHKMHGQQAIDSERVAAIQSALIREHYMSGESSGKWDSGTQQAMLKFQADQGWQTKLTPDSRALIKLGLGPDHSKAINASSGATFNDVSTPSVAVQPEAQGFVAASGVSH